MKHENSRMKIGIVLPVYNVEETIRDVLVSITPALLEHIGEILFIDNCSSDRTVALINNHLSRHPEFARRSTLILNQENYGYGSSIKAGFDYFVNRPVSHVVVIHGDHQVSPNWLLSRMIEAVQSDMTLDLVLASRFKRESNIKGYSLLRILGNHFFNLTTFLCTGLVMSDAGTAMMIVRRDILKSIPFRNLSNSWQFHPQLNILLYGKTGIHLREIPLNWTDSKASSTVPLYSYGCALLKLLVSYRIGKTVLRKNPVDIFPVQPMRANRKFVMRTGQGAPVSSYPELSASAR